MKYSRISDLAASWLRKRNARGNQHNEESCWAVLWIYKLVPSRSPRRKFNIFRIHYKLLYLRALLPQHGHSHA